MATAASGRFPDFFIIGSAKAGSTALWRALRRHPDIFMPALKEPNFFAYKGHPLNFRCPGAVEVAGTWITDEAVYKRLFAVCPNGSRAGEGSAGYLASASAPVELAAAVPDARLVTILRHPVDRAFSHWLFFRQSGRERITDFEAAIAAAPDRLSAGWRPGWDYLQFGCYGTQLDRWLQFFDRSQLLVLFYEDWKSHPQQVLRQVCDHIGVGYDGEIPVTSENTTSYPRWPAIVRWMSADTPVRRLAHRLMSARFRDAITNATRIVNATAKPQLAPAARLRLLEYYAAETDLVEAITGRDLSAWRR